MSDSVTIQQTERLIFPSSPAPNWRLTLSANPLFNPNAKLVIKLYSADVAPICASAASAKASYTITKATL